MTFYLPYHFVPVKARTDAQKQQDVAVSDLRTTPRLGHHHYAEGTYSGRILCRLTNETPMFIGARREKNTTPATVEPFELGGEPAIPGTSLRGLLSSIAEAASGSAPRVLDDGLLSYRKGMGDALHAVGMIVEAQRDDGSHCYQLRPLVLPLLTASESGGAATIPGDFVSLFVRDQEAPDAPLKVFVGKPWEIRKPDFGFETFHRGAPKYYGLPLVRRRLTQDSKGVWGLEADDPQRSFQDRRGMGARGELLLSQKPTRHGVSPRSWDEIPETERSQYTKGILRVLGVAGRDDMPNTKKHELFLPLPPGAETVDDIPAFDVLPSAVERFHELADQRTDDEPHLPYEPRNTPRNAGGDQDHFRLKDGDLVFFKPTGDGRIAEIALSSIWRGRVESEADGEMKKATARTFFTGVDEDLVPFHKGRQRLTHAEQLFGFVAADRAEADPGELPSQGLAGRVRISNGRWVDPGDGKGAYLDAVALKVLANPKPPSPALYFRKKGSPGYIPKSDLNPAAHHPQGRKMYVHHKLAGGGDRPWETADPQERAEMISEIRPLRWKQKFVFHLDFQNLSEADLGLLLYALRPSDGFHHKLGMGKPLGLGTVRIDPVAILCIDRHRRYTAEGFFGPRYHHYWCDPEADLAFLRAMGYDGEAAALETLRRNSGVEGGGNEARQEEPGEAALEVDFRVLRDRYAATLDPTTREALELLGTAQLQPVRQPLVEGQEDPEDETFQWFVANDHGSGPRRSGIDAARQFLKPLDSWLSEAQHDGPFPSLDTNDWMDD